MDTFLIYVKELFTYDPILGKLYWKHSPQKSPQWNGRYAGREAGCVAHFEKGGPYRVVNIGNSTHLVHRIIWLYVHGYLPETVDHEDNCGLNNCLNNLRDATQSQNNANKSIVSKGYTRHGNKFRARIKVQGEQIELGSYRTEEEASFAYIVASIKYFGEFSSCRKM